jgi:type I restriction enzyme S subunit
MIEGLKPYTDYKESGLAWLETIPGHWRTARNGILFQQRNDTRFPDLPILEVSLRTGVRIREFSSSKRKQVMADASKYKRACAGDVAYNMMRMWQGAVGVAPVDGLVSPAYVVARPFPGTQSRYYTALFKCELYMCEIDAASRGIVKDRNRLYWDQFKQMQSLAPPPDEQAAIVKFLDYANGKIERAIRAKRKLIGLLNEQKQAIIHRAVTRGLDANVKLKPSGIPWLGDAPEHWEVRPIKNWAKINLRTLGQSTNPNFEFRYIDIGSVRTGYLVKEPERMQFAKAPSRARRVLFPGDTIVSTVRTYLKAVWFVGLEAENLIASTGFAVFSPNDELEPEYLHYVLQDSSFVNQVTANSIGIAYPAISETVMARFHVPIPPSRPEQQAVIAAIKLQLKPVTDLITRLQYEIDLLREYRTTLTAEVVTGKLDAREAAKRLPDQGDEPLPLDESMEDLVDDEITEEVEA